MDVERLFSPLIEQAVELAAEWHDRTYRKSRWRAPAYEPPVEEGVRVPVMAHVTAVALIVQRAGWPDAAVAAAFLHDVLEDANRFGQSFLHKEMLRLVGDEVTVLVEIVTEQKRDAEGAYRTWQDRKDGYLVQLRRGTPDAAAISLADKLHNLWSINQSLGEGVDVFENAPGRRALSAGPAKQRWFHQAVLDATRTYDDSRLVPMRARLQREIDRFAALTGQAGADERAPNP